MQYSDIAIAIEKIWKEKSTPFSPRLKRSQVLYRAAQVTLLYTYLHHHHHGSGQTLPFALYQQGAACIKEETTEVLQSQHQAAAGMI